LNFIADNSYTNSSFERKCGLPNATLANAKKRGSDLTSDVVETISKTMGSELESAGYHIMDMRPFGRQELAILSSEEARKLTSALGPPKIGSLVEDKITNPAVGVNGKDNESDTLKDILRVQARTMEAILKLMDRQDRRSERMEASLDKLIEGQGGGLALVLEVLNRDVRREADGNPEKEKKIRAEIARRIGPKLNADLQEDISTGAGR